LWPLVRDFWQENGFLIKVEQPEIGVMETEWAESRARVPQGGVRGLLSKAFDTLYSTSERDKYRTRLDRTAEGNGTEIYVSHRGMVEVYTTKETQNPGAPGATAWQPREPDPELEAEYLRRLMVRLGVQEEKARTLVASTGTPAPQAAGGGRAQIRKGVDGAAARHRKPGERAEQGRRRRQLEDSAAHPDAAAGAAEVSCCASPRSRAAAAATAWWRRPT